MIKNNLGKVVALLLLLMLQGCVKQYNVNSVNYSTAIDALNAHELSVKEHLNEINSLQSAVTDKSLVIAIPTKKLWLDNYSGQYKGYEDFNSKFNYP